MEIDSFVKIDQSQVAPISIKDLEDLSQTNAVISSLLQSLAKTAESIVVTAEETLHSVSTEEESLAELQKMLQMRAICNQAVQDMAKNINRGKSKATEGYDLN